MEARWPRLPRRRPWGARLAAADASAASPEAAEGADGGPWRGAEAAEGAGSEACALARQLHARLDQAAEKRAAQLEATRVKARQLQGRARMGRKSAKEAEARARLRARARLQAAQLGAEGRRKSHEAETLERLRASHARARSRACSAAAEREHEAAARRAAAEARLARAQARREERLRPRPGSAQAGAAAACGASDLVESAEAFAARRAARRLQRAWRAFDSTGHLAREFHRKAVAVLKQPEAPSPALAPGAARAAGAPPSWAFDPEDAARVQAFEEFAGRLHSRALLGATSALLARLEARVLGLVAGAPAELGAVWARVFPRRPRGAPPPARFPARVFLCAFMIRSFPEVVFSEATGPREAALHAQALAMTADFRALLKTCVSADEGSRRPGAVARALAAFDQSWVAFADRFATWKTKDAAALEADLIGVVCRLQESVFEKCGTLDVERDQAVARSHDLSAIVLQLKTDKKLIETRVRALTGHAGVQRLRGALEASQAEVGRRLQQKSRAEDRGERGRGEQQPTGAPTPAPAAAAASDGDLRKDRMLLETLYDPDYRLPDAAILADLAFCGEFSAEDSPPDEGGRDEGPAAAEGPAPLSATSLPSHVKKAMERAFWAGVVAGVDRDPPDTARLVEVLRDLAEEIKALVPKNRGLPKARRSAGAALKRGSEDLEALLQGSAPTPENPHVPAALVEHLEALAAMLFYLGAPAREELLQDGFSRILKQARAPQAGRTASAFKLCMCARYLFVAVRLTKLDVANSHLRQLVHLAEGDTAFEAAGDGFLRRHGVAAGSLTSLRERAPRTCAWLAAGQRRESELRQASLAPAEGEGAGQGGRPGGGSCGSGDVSYAPAGMQTGRALPMAAAAPSRVQSAWYVPRLAAPFAAGSPEAVLAVGLADLMQSSEELVAEGLPELLDLDVARVREAHSDFQRLLVLACCCIVLRSSCPRLGDAALRDHLDRVAALLEDEGTRLEDLGIHLAAAVAGSPAGPGGPTGEAAVARLLRQLLDPAAGLQAVQRNVLAAVHAHLLLGCGAPAAEAAAAQALQRVHGRALAGRACALAGRLRRVALVAARAHGGLLRPLLA